jgi:hypothetical protein
MSDNNIVFYRDRGQVLPEVGAAIRQQVATKAAVRALFDDR